MPLRFIAASFACLFLLVGVRARAADPVLAVLYIDNHSGDAAYDVLEKGLADMLVTDLSAQGLTVVERSRLQALIAEQKLQRSAFFDAKTAVRVGQGLGATHIVMGALAAMKPELRIDLRLVEVATGKVVVTAKVNGPSASLFDLEQQLVERFVTAFERRFASAPMPQTKVRDVEALLEYSRGIDLADRGELEAAKKKIDQTIKLSPSFGLARTRKDELVKRIEASRDRRDLVIEDNLATLEKHCREALAPKALTSDASRLAWRSLETMLIGLRLQPLLSGDNFSVAAFGQEKALRAAMIARAESASAYIAELDAFRAKMRPNTMFDAHLPDSDEKLAKSIRLDPRAQDTPSEARHQLARFLLLGTMRLDTDRTIIIGPPLANLDKTWDGRAWRLIAEADKLAAAGPFEHYALGTLDSWAEALLLRNRTDEAIAKWQEILDRYPTSQQFDRFEKRIKGLLGVEHDHETSELASWSNGLQVCTDMPFRVGINTVMYRRMRMLGLDALPEVAAEVERHCKGKPGVAGYWSSLYTTLALAYGRHGRCAGFETWMDKALKAGGSASEIASYRNNYTKCPVP